VTGLYIISFVLMCLSAVLLREIHSTVDRDTWSTWCHPRDAHAHAPRWPWGFPLTVTLGFCSGVQHDIPPSRHPADREVLSPLWVGASVAPGRTASFRADSMLSIAAAAAQLAVVPGLSTLPGHHIRNDVNPNGVPTIPDQFYAVVNGSTVGNVSGVPTGTFTMKQWYDYTNLRQRIDRDDGTTKMCGARPPPSPALARGTSLELVLALRSLAACSNAWIMHYPDGSSACAQRWIEESSAALK
jgi:hypothetical protein